MGASRAGPQGGKEQQGLAARPPPGCHPPGYHPPRYSGVPQGSLMSPFSSLARWKSLMTILEFFRRL